jgi:hypothetical protein
MFPKRRIQNHIKNILTSLAQLIRTSYYIAKVRTSYTPLIHLKKGFLAIKLFDKKQNYMKNSKNNYKRASRKNTHTLLDFQM